MVIVPAVDACLVNAALPLTFPIANNKYVVATSRCNVPYKHGMNIFIFLLDSLSYQTNAVC